MREPIGGRGGLRLEPSAVVNRLTNELLYNWTNGRIWFALLLFWAVLIELRLLAATNDEFQVIMKVSLFFVVMDSALLGRFAAPSSILCTPWFLVA